MQQTGNDFATSAEESPSISLGRAALAVLRSLDQLATPLSETLLTATILLRLTYPERNSD